MLPNYHLDNATISIIIHHSDTVSISIGCTNFPIAKDVFGLIRLTNILVRIEEHLSHIINCCTLETTQADNTIIPNCYSWIITLWHLGVDSISEYAGEKFECSWETAEGILTRLYSKQFSDKNIRIRLEKQESPKIRVDDLILETLYPDGRLL
jgi:hypothetical protein